MLNINVNVNENNINSIELLNYLEYKKDNIKYNDLNSSNYVSKLYLNDNIITLKNSNNKTELENTIKFICKYYNINKVPNINFFKVDQLENLKELFNCFIENEYKSFNENSYYYLKVYKEHIENNFKYLEFKDIIFYLNHNIECYLDYDIIEYDILYLIELIKDLNIFENKFNQILNLNDLKEYFNYNSSIFEFKTELENIFFYNENFYYTSNNLSKFLNIDICQNIYYNLNDIIIKTIINSLKDNHIKFKLIKNLDNNYIIKLNILDLYYYLYYYYNIDYLDYNIKDLILNYLTLELKEHDLSYFENITLNEFEQYYNFDYDIMLNNHKRSSYFNLNYFELINYINSYCNTILNHNTNFKIDLTEYFFNNIIEF